MAKLEIDLIDLTKAETKEKVYARLVYDIVKNETDGLDAVYEDFIEHCVGTFGHTALIKAKLLESCGVVNGRRLYTLLDWKE